ncbi:MAG: hypothetical protein ACT4N4_02885, partial [Rhodospirillales bacterium]
MSIQTLGPALAVALICSCLHQPARAAEPPAEPLLRISAEMHTAPIFAAAVDAQERMIATASQDKTARLWSLATGELLRVLRPPIGHDLEGRLHAVALSPDGRLLATGGWTGWDWNRKGRIYLFETGSGRLARVVENLAGTIHGLAWAKDGRHLVATLGGTAGMRAIRTGDWTEAAADSGYKAVTHGVAVSARGFVATASYDGFVRLYDADFKLVRKERWEKRGLPRSVAFSWDGARLAVGYSDPAAIDVHSAADLSRLAELDVSKTNLTEIHTVAWTKQGRVLGGGGNTTPGARLDDRRMFAWDAGGKGPAAPIVRAPRPGFAGPKSSVSTLVALADGGVVFATQDPAIGRVDAQGAPVFERRGEQSVFRRGRNVFAASFNGASVRFTASLADARPSGFSVEERRFGSYPSEREGVSPPVRQHPDFPLTNWYGAKNAKIGDRALKLKDQEISRDLAIDAAGGAFLLASDWSIRRFGRDGEVKWAAPSVAGTWNVTLSGDRRLAVASFHDGTIRWRRWDDGRELLSLFVHADGRRWIMWTPDGHYDASPGAENLIGWHLNNGAGAAADFFPVARFRDRFYRPDAINKVLAALDVKDAVRFADAQAGRKARDELGVRDLRPPVIASLSPEP